jgi:hypothetical protein
VARGNALVIQPRWSQIADWRSALVPGDTVDLCVRGLVRDAAGMGQLGGAAWVKGWIVDRAHHRVCVMHDHEGSFVGAGGGAGRVRRSEWLHRDDEAIMPAGTHPVLHSTGSLSELLGGCSDAASLEEAFRMLSEEAGGAGAGGEGVTRGSWEELKRLAMVAKGGGKRRGGGGGREGVGGGGGGGGGLEAKSGDSGRVIGGGDIWVKSVAREFGNAVKAYKRRPAGGE